MRSEWFDTTIGDQITLQRGFDITSRDLRPGTVPVVSSSGTTGYHDTAAVKAPGVVIGRKGSLGTAFLLTEDYWPHDTTLWVKDFKGNDPRFVYHFLRSLRVMHLDVGSANPTLNRNHVHPIPVRWPPTQEQSRIAEVLGALDDKIELNHRTSETLDTLVRTAFEMRFGVSEDNAQELVRLDALAALVRGTINPQLAPDQIFEHYSLPAFDAGRVPVRERGAEIKSTKTRVPPGAVLLSKLNPDIERVWLPAKTHEYTAICSTEFLILTPKGVVTRSYLYGLFTSKPFREALAAGVTGTSNSHQRARPDDLLRIEVPAPSEPLVREYDEIATPLLDQIQQHRNESMALALLRDTLLPRLLSGELRVREAEPLIAAAV